MKTAGFTLIELMVVIVVLAIIVAIAVPAYNNQVQKARRSDAHSALMNAAQTLERCYTRFNVYNAAGCPDVTGTSPEGFYNIALPTITPTEFTLTATPTGPQTADASKCPSFGYDHLGRKFVDAVEIPPDPERCWR